MKFLGNFALIFAFIALECAHADYESPLPYFLPPTTEAARQSTNLLEQIYGGNEEKMTKQITRSFEKLDLNSDGVLTIDEFMVAINQTASNTGSPEDPTDEMQIIIDNISQADSDRNGNITISELVSVYSKAFTSNFTLLPSICLEASARINLCELDMEQNITDSTILGQTDIPAKSFFAREQLKCQSGLSGFESDFAFQRCILGNPCNRIIPDCFGRKFAENPIDYQIAEFSSQNVIIDHSIKSLTRLPFNDPEFQEFISATNGNNPGEITTSVVKTGFWSAILLMLGRLTLEIVKTQVIPLIEAGLSQAIASFLAWLTALSPQVWTVLGGLIAIIVIGWFSIKNIIALIASLQSSSRDLLMASWNPYEGELEPKCEWVVYQEQKCWSNGQLKAYSSAVCDKGGEMYRDRECNLKNLKTFYQTSCMMGCRHLCLKTDFSCGDDGYSYRNSTEFLYSNPTPSLNQYMFNPGFSNKQYVLLDSRYVYRMTECRDTCDRFSQNLAGNGITSCKGFLLQAPDPLLDSRPAFSKRQVCNLLGENMDRNVQTDNLIFNSSSISSRGSEPRQFPVYLNSANEIFQFNAMQNNQYPPMIVALQN